MAYHLTLVSQNKKTGPIPTSTSGKETCPKECPFCYALFGPQALHWKKVTAGLRGWAWKGFCTAIRKLARGVYWRHNVSGDLPHNDGTIDRGMVESLVQANRGKHGWTYTHHSPTVENIETVRFCNDNGFTVNWSADNVVQADRLAEFGPVAVIMPSDSPKVSYTPHGHKVVICPAEWHNAQSGRITCAQCRLCTESTRGYMIGFLPHGTRKKFAEIVAAAA